MNKSTEQYVKRFNGMVEVDWVVIEYRGFKIQPKLDMGKYPHLYHGNSYSTGWAVVKDGTLALPGASWFTSALAAKAGVDLWIEAEANIQRFNLLMKDYSF